MANRIHDAYNSIKAEEKLKQNTRSFLEQKIDKKKGFSLRRFTVAFTSVCLLIFAGLFSYNRYFTGTAFVDIDVNPSIELTLNRFDRVIASDAYNEDGVAILSEVSIQHKTYKEALKILIDEMVAKGYIRDSSLLSATLQMDDSQNEEKIFNNFKSYIDSLLEDSGKTVEQNVFEVDITTKITSHDLHLTPAKYLAIKELQTLDPTASFNSCRNHTIREINQKISDCQREHGKNNSEFRNHESCGENNESEGEHQNNSTPSRSHEQNDGEQSHEQNDDKHLRNSDPIKDKPSQTPKSHTRDTPKDHKKGTQNEHNSHHNQDGGDGHSK